MTDSDARTVRHEHGGVEWDILVDLLEIQRRFDAATADCARLAETDGRNAYLAAQQWRLTEVLAHTNIHGCASSRLTGGATKPTRPSNTSPAARPGSLSECAGPEL